ncbi:hypothetical protein M413DRAFT_21133 [Hebeloma cylindrosporum]|uniref:Uncharacterized protein n=1 Tax=Hebeloma cylindrosporum TaxID=76867 RepID=A0A0C2Z6K5_HEBCY|nr:hypothetical protein M413DRAFT_21133 [Hebeloma cylindrosporum h7]
MVRSPSIRTKLARQSTKTKVEEEEVEPSFSDELETDNGEGDEEDTAKEELIAAVRKSLVEKSKKSSARSGTFEAQKKALYLAARKAAKEIVGSGVTTLEDIQVNMAALQSQEVGFDKFYGDCHLPQISHEESFRHLSDFYPSVLRDIGPLRAEKINAASATLQENAHNRQEALKVFSKQARHQLEEAKQNERDAVDAAKLITNVKNLLRA